MRAEFLRDEEGSTDVVATASWDGRGFEVEAQDSDVRAAVERIFRLTPVVVDDPTYRPLYARGEAVIQPGNADWFRAAAYGRAASEGLKARVVPEVVGQGGWDPAAAYRTFREDVARLLQRGIRQSSDDAQPGERAPQERAETGDQPRASDSPPNVQ
jgi:hypothetical protein